MQNENHQPSGVIDRLTKEIAYCRSDKLQMNEYVLINIQAEYYHFWRIIYSYLNQYYIMNGLGL